MRKRRLWVLAIALLSFFSSCQELEKVIPAKENQETQDSPKEEEINPEVGEQPKADIKKYVIRKGEQHATLSYQEIAADSLKFRVLFDSSAVYKTILAENQGDINKLYGVSDCGSFHHNNSARFGWRWFDDQLEIWAYTYVNGERQSSFVDTVALDKFYTYQIRFSENKYTFLLNDKEIEMPRACNGAATGYKLFPYFGGDESAPHDISIWVEELKN